MQPEAVRSCTAFKDVETTTLKALSRNSSNNVFRPDGKAKQLSNSVPNQVSPARVGNHPHIELESFTLSVAKPMQYYTHALSSPVKS